MKILFLNTFDKKGGAAKFCYRLKSYLDFNGFSSWLLVRKKDYTEPSILEIKISFFQKVLNKIFFLDGIGFNTFSRLKKFSFWDKIDLAHFHNLHGGYFNIFSILKISKYKKCLWTLHDPWIVYRRKKLVPEYKNIFRKEFFLFSFLRYIVIKKSDIVFVTPSLWLKHLVLKNYPNKRVEVINNCVDTKIFKNIDKDKARSILNLPADKNIVLFVANGGIDNKEKGVTYIEEVKKRYNNFLFIELGGDSKYIENENDLAVYYAAADVFLLPSLAENFPLSILEAMSCGTPALAFNVGGIGEIIDHKEDGYLAEYENLQDLCTGMDYIVNKKKDSILSTNARKKVVDKFDQDFIFTKYIDLYKSLI